MRILFKTLFIYISNLGLLTAEIFKDVYGFLSRTVFSLIKRMFSKIGLFNKKSISSPLVFLSRTAVFIVAVLAIAALVFILSSTTEKTAAVEVTYGDKSLGFTETET